MFRLNTQWPHELRKLPAKSHWLNTQFLWSVECIFCECGRNKEFYLFVSLKLKRNRHRMKANQYSKSGYISINTVWRMFHYSAVFFLYAIYSRTLTVCYFTLTKELYMFVLQWTEEICTLALTAPRTLSVKNANIEEKYDNLWY